MINEEMIVIQQSILNQHIIVNIIFRHLQATVHVVHNGMFVIKRTSMVFFSEVGILQEINI